MQTGSSYFVQKNYEIAAEYLHKALPLAEAEFGKASPQYAGTLRNLGETNRLLGKYSEAEEWFLESLGIQKQIYEDDDTKYRSTLEGLALLYHMQGMYDKATALNVSLDWNTTFQIANIYFRNSRFEKGITIAEQSLVKAEEEFGKAHENYIFTANSLVDLYRYMLAYDKVHTLGGTLSARQIVYQANQYRLEGHYSLAQEWVEMALDSTRRESGEWHKDYAVCLNVQAELYRGVGKYKAAEPLYFQALDILDSIQSTQTEDYMATLNNLGLLYEKMLNFKKSEYYYARCLKLRERINGKENELYASLLNNVGEVYRLQGKYNQAASLYLESLSIMAKTIGAENGLYAATLSNLGLTYQRQGIYGEAEKLFLQCIEIEEEIFGTHHLNFIESLNILASFYKEIGQNKKAITLIRRNLELYQQGIGTDNTLYAKGLNTLGTLYLAVGQLTEAESCFSRCEEIRASVIGKDNLDYASILANLATSYLYLNKDDQAKSLSLENLKIINQEIGKDNPFYIEGLRLLARIHARQKNFSTADSIYNSCEQSLDNIYGKDHPYKAKFYSDWAMTNFDSKNYPRTKELLEVVNNNFLTQISRYFPYFNEAEKGAFYQTINSHFEFYNSFAQVYQEQDSQIYKTIYNNQLNTKALLLNSAKTIRERILSSQDSLLLSMYQEWVDLREYLAQLYTLSQADIEKRSVNLDSLQTVSDHLEKELSLRSESFAGKLSASLFGWHNIQGALNPQEAAIEIIRFKWFDKTWTDTVYYAALIVTPETKEHPEIVLLPNGNNLEGEHLRDYQRCRKVKSGKAYQQYWQPIQEKLSGIKKVYLSPDGIYNKINLNILYNDDTQQYLVDEIDIHLVTNTKEILQFGVENKSGNTAQIFGRPAYDLDSTQHHLALAGLKRSDNNALLSDKESTERQRANFSDLAGTEKEVKDISRLLNNEGWKSTAYLGETALEEAVKSTNNPRVLHIATHGFFIASGDEDFRRNQRNITPIGTSDNQTFKASSLNPMLRSGLVLAGAASYLKATEKPDTDDGILTAYEAANLSLDDTELVVLSACETGLGELRNGEGVYGLQRAFKVAGAKTILMSLWKVDDTATQELMSTFYEKWLEHGDKRRAFREAQLLLREKYKQPEYWGAFVMVGE